MVAQSVLRLGGGSVKWERKIQGGKSFNEGSLRKRVLKENLWQRGKAAESYSWKCFPFLMLQRWEQRQQLHVGWVGAVHASLGSWAAGQG